MAIRRLARHHRLHRTRHTYLPENLENSTTATQPGWKITSRA
ncbi:hypothetical protein ACFWF7_37270 [Nocardia sp. NPDC060256]